MADDIVKVDSMLNDPIDDEAVLADDSVPRATGARAIASKVKNGAVNVGTKTLAGGMAVVQTTSITSVATILSIILGLGTAAGGNYQIQFRDDINPDNPYECIDEYSEAYRGAFGTINMTPLASQNSVIIQRLKEINEWSKNFVGQSVPDKLICDEQDCPYYGHEGCTDPDHLVRKFDKGENTYYDLGGKIDLAYVKRIHSFFSAYGLTDVQIAAICGVMTMESRIDFTSLEGYNLSGDRYNIDPSAITDEYGFKAWAEGIGDSPIDSPTCIHQIIANSYDGPDQPIDYAGYSAEYPSIYKLGIGIIGFTDGPGFYNNTFLRNYADHLNDKVTLIQRIVEGSRGWREELRQRAADLYHYAYGANGNDKRGTGTGYIEQVDPETLLLLDDPPEQSTGWRYKKAWDDAQESGLKAKAEALEDAIDDYEALVEAYQNAMQMLSEMSFMFHDVEFSAEGGEDIHSFDFDEAFEKWVTDLASGQYVDIFEPETIKECDVEDDINVYGYVEYPENPAGPQNYLDVVFRQAKAELGDEVTGTTGSVTVTDNGLGSNPFLQMAAMAEQMAIDALLEALESAKSQMGDAYQAVLDAFEEYKELIEEFNEASVEHAKSVVNFYNALQDYYTASEFDMESRIRDATYNKDTIFGEARFFSEAAYEYEFDEIIDGERIKFRTLFDEFASEDDDEDEDKPTPQELKLYYELWQNYAKYATNLPQNGKYINWWVPEVQLLYMVGGSYDAENDKGLKIRDEYKESTCSICGQGMPDEDTTGKYYYDWMSTWKGEDYTSRDLTTATKNFFLDMVSGGWDDGTLKTRTEYAYAYYYMFQYDSPYQQAINYASVGGEASKIMEEMIAEGRWQTNPSNTLSDAAMPHNDKWKEYQEAEIVRQWEIDTSTSMSTSILATLGSQQSRSRVNLLTDIWNGCRYINVIDNSTIGNSAMYLVDNPLIYGDTNDKFYIMKYGKDPDPAPEPVSSLYKVVFNTINQRLQDNGKQSMGDDNNLSDGFTFVKTSILWSGLDVEFENINDIEDLKEYLKEATSSVWQDESEYQTDPDPEKAIGRGNTKIWEQRKLGPYYDENGEPYYRYKWVLVSRVLDDDEDIDTQLKWYDDMRNDDASHDTGDPTEDLDHWDEHHVDEHDTNNTPSKAKGEEVDGYLRKLNENKRNADWVRIDWECWDEECEICGGKGGHGDINLLVPGDLLVSDDTVCLWLGEDTVQSMFPLEANSDTKLVYAGGDEATRLKSMDDAVGFEWSKPCDSYIDHETPCPEHDTDAELPTEAEPADPDSCKPYNPEGKWTVYRLITPNYTDAYRSAGLIYDMANETDWETWYKYKYKGMSPNADTRRYLEEVRKEIGADIDTSDSDYNRNRM